MIDTRFGQVFLPSSNSLSVERTSMERSLWKKQLCSVIAGLMLSTSPLLVDPVMAASNVAGEYSASFENADISEFANTISATLNKTVILDPAVRGNITVRSYDRLSKEQYYSLFLNVLEVHGFAVVEQENNVLKVVPDKNAKLTAIPLADEKNPGKGDEFVTWVLALENVPVRELSPLLRQLNDNAGNVVHYDPSNILLLTGRASNVERMVDIARRIDRAGNRDFSVIQLEHASASEMQRIITALNQETGSKSKSPVTVVADERSNRLIVAGQPSELQKINRIVYQLDAEQETSGNTRVFYLRYAKAEELKEVMEGVGQTVQAEKTTGNAATRSRDQQFSINVHEQTNALVVTAQPDMMKTLENVVKQLDIRRAQVLVEAIIVEVADGDGINLSFQLANSNGTSLMQFNDGSTVPIGQIMAGLKEAEGQEGSVIIDENGREIHNPDTDGDYSMLAQALSGVQGAAFSITSGDWTALLQAVTTSSKSNVLATPSLMTLDNEEASFVVGDEVPVITGSTAGSDNANPYQTVDRQEVGVKLNVTPQINEGDSVKLDIVQEVSGINGATSVDVTFSKREVTTSVMARSGDTVVIGGLIDEDVQESVSKVPLLGDIPFIGALFRSTSSTVSKRNLMVFIRPTIIRDDNILSDISGKKYTYMRARQLDRRDQGVELMPDARTPVLPEYPTNSDLMDEARRHLERNDGETETVEEEKEEKVASKQTEKDDAESVDNS